MTTPPDRPRVLLVHGLLLSAVSMAGVGARLARLGWRTSYFGYSSLFERTEHAESRLAHTLRREPTVIVAHSLGGLLSLETLTHHPDLPVDRVVCLGSPLRGSGAALGLHRFPGAALAVGRSDGLLRRGVTRWPGHLQVGMLAGRVPVGLGAAFAGFGGHHDGTVSVDETHVPALTDHRVVNASHTGMLLDADVARQVDAFLRNGTFG